ncbi:MAG: hypothetical protein VKJ24_21415 [Synechococcales bacterium]|nr:hypothetical protein [Synechococcales bacterium]
MLETVQIGGIAGRDLNLTQVQGGVGAINVFGTVQVGQAPINLATPLTQQEYRWRRVLLDKVKQFWIEGVLEKSLHTKVLLELGLESWNYARFLDHAVDRLFLQKVGGGYIFVHRMLLEHFAAMEWDRTQR